VTAGVSWGMMRPNRRGRENKKENSPRKGERAGGNEYDDGGREKARASSKRRRPLYRLRPYYVKKPSG